MDERTHRPEPAREAPTFLSYLGEGLHRSLVSWDFGPRHGEIVSGAIQGVLAFITVVAAGLGIAGTTIVVSPLALKIIAGLGVAYFLGLIFLRTPYVMWRAERMRALESRRKLSARLSVRIPPNPVSETMAVRQSRHVRSKWVWVVAVNDGLEAAPGCRAYLKSVERWEEGRQAWMPTACDRQYQLLWSPHDKEPRLLQHGIENAIDVLCAEESDNMLRLNTYPEMNQFINVFDDAGEYRLQIVVAGEEAQVSEPLYLRIDWGGTWDQIEVLR